MEERHVRGDIMRTYFDYVKKKWGVAGLDESLKATGLDPKSFKPADWVSTDMSMRYFSWIIENKGEEHSEAMGNFAVKNLGFLKYMVRFVELRAMLRKAQKLFDHGFDYGNVEMEDNDSHIIIHFTDAFFDKRLCPTWIGTFRGMLELTRTAGKVSKVSCQGDGDETCSYRIDLE